MIIYTYLTDDAEKDTITIKDLTLKKRDTEVLSIYFMDEVGAAVDITGATVFFTIKPTVGTVDASATLAKTITSLTDPTAGEAEITIAATDLTSISAGNYLYDITIKQSDDTIKTVAEGNLCISADITIRTE